MNTSIPGDLFDLSPTDGCAIAVQDTLIANADLLDWTENRIFRHELSEVPEDIVPPAIIVSAATDGVEFKVGGCADISMTVAVTTHWEVAGVFLDPTDPSISSVTWLIKKTLRANPSLAVARFGMMPLASRMLAFKEVDFMGMERSDGRLLLSLVLVADYVLMGAPASTMAPVGWPPAP